MRYDEFMTEGAFPEYKEHTGTCPMCGNSPVNHFQTYLSYTMSAWGAEAGRKIGWNPIRALRSFSGTLADRVEPLVYRGISRLPGSRFGSDPSQASTYRSQVVWEEAARRGITMEQLFLGKSKTDIYRATLSGHSLYFNSLPTALFQRANDAWVDDKLMLKEMLAKEGIAVPRACSATTLGDAERAFHELGAPVVVKPRLGSRGRHTTVGVRTVEELKIAFKSAKELCRYVAIEECLEGPVCRATLVGGQLAGFFEAYPPRVTGDGVHTISELIETQNANKPDRVQDISLTGEHLDFLRRAGYTLGSAPQSGETISLTHRTGRLFGGRTREILGLEHPKLREVLERAAKKIPGPIVGFDLIIPDPSRDPELQTWGIIEANTLPYIDLHYLPLEGEPSNVARAVWEWVEAELARV